MLTLSFGKSLGWHNREEMELLPKQQINIVVESDRVDAIVEIIKQKLMKLLKNRLTDDVWL